MSEMPTQGDSGSQAQFLGAMNSFEQLMGTSPAFMDTFMNYNDPPSNWAEVRWDGLSGPGSKRLH